MSSPQAAMIQGGAVSWHTWDAPPARAMLKQGTADSAAFPPIKWEADLEKEQLGSPGSSQEGSGGLQSVN